MAKQRKLKIGDTIDYLTILEFTGVKPVGSKRLNYCKCRCKCGNVVEIPVTYVGKVYKSCGCLQAESKRKDIKPDTVFGRLTVIERTDKKSHNCYLYRCKCECGKEVLVRSDSLRGGDTKSCGCLHDDLLQENVKKAYKNNFVYNTNISRISSSKIQKNNTSGVTGVRWHKKSQMWHASIGFQKKYYSLGYYHDIKKAAKIRQVAEKELFGNFLDWYHETFPQKGGKRK